MYMYRLTTANRSQHGLWVHRTGTRLNLLISLRLRVHSLLLDCATDRQDKSLDLCASR